MGMPDPPFQATPLAANAVANHEFVETYVNAGFSRAEAMQLLMMIIWFGLVNSSDG